MLWSTNIPYLDISRREHVHCRHLHADQSSMNTLHRYASNTVASACPRPLALHFTESHTIRSLKNIIPNSNCSLAKCSCMGGDSYTSTIVMEKARGLGRSKWTDNMTRPFRRRTGMLAVQCARYRLRTQDGCLRHQSMKQSRSTRM